MWRRSLLSLLLTLAWVSQARSQAIEARELFHSSLVSVNLEQTQIEIQENKVSTQGLNVQYTYSLKPRLFVEVGLGTGFNGEINSLDAAFLGFNTYAHFSVWGKCCTGEKSVLVDSKTTYIEKQNKDLMVLVGAGLEQLLLNGSDQVYSSSGWGAQISLLTHPWNQNVRLNLKSSQLTSSGNPVTVLQGSVGLYFSY